MPRKAGRTVLDAAGGTVIGTLAPTVFTNDTPVAVVGDPVEGHGIGKHAGPVMMTGSDNVFAHGIPVCRIGDVATCGHPIVSNSNDTFVN
jgi:uncharacterized Zn-binding protein involved in type VI secretion